MRRALPGSEDPADPWIQRVIGEHDQPAGRDTGRQAGPSGDVEAPTVDFRGEPAVHGVLRPKTVE